MFDGATKTKPARPWMTSEELAEERDRERGGPCLHCKGACQIRTRWDHHCEVCGTVISPESGSWHYCAPLDRMDHDSRRGPDKVLTRSVQRDASARPIVDGVARG